MMREVEDIANMRVIENEYIICSEKLNEIAADQVRVVILLFC
jgi:hypothetical protein